MKNFTSKTIDTLTFKDTQLQASFFQPKEKDMQATIFYFHGGGLIFGHRDDLPEKYIELLAEHGIALLAVDYPLAPETKMKEILKSVLDLTDWFVQDFLAAIGQEKYFIMGRSAGGFLALTSALHTKELAVPAQGVISLYGYYNLNDAAFAVANPYYLKYPPVSDSVIAALIKKDQIVTKGDQNRFLLYLASRQKGDWMNLLLGSAQEKRKLSMDREAIESLPPLFLAAASGDPDVPSRQTRQLANFHPAAELTIYNLAEHDFDRTHQQTHGLPTYQMMVRWILDLL